MNNIITFPNGYWLRPSGNVGQKIISPRGRIIVYNEETEAMIGSVETLDIADAPQLKKMLGFFLYALSERVEMPVAE